MKILIISNPDNEEYVDDKFLADAFIKDGHKVEIARKDYPEKLESEYDIFIKRNAYDLNVNNFKLGVDPYQFVTRLQNKNLPRINCDAQFDGKGKDYLAVLFQQGYEVIPTINKINDFDKLPQSDTYLLKPHNGFDGFGIEEVTKEEAIKKFTNSYIIQPKIKFQSEVQFYFVGNKFEYALEYRPSKYPNWPNPEYYNYSVEDLSLAQKFADLSLKYNGVQRIDFIKLDNRKLLLLEIEDSSPNLSLYLIDEKRKIKFAEDYKIMVYDYYKNFNKNVNI